MQASRQAGMQPARQACKQAGRRAARPPSPIMYLGVVPQVLGTIIRDALF